MTRQGRSLRVVAPGEAPAKKRTPMTVTKAAADGSRADLLAAMRARVAAAVEDSRTPAPALAALTRRLLEIDAELKAIDEAGPEDPPPPGDEPFDRESI